MELNHSSIQINSKKDLNQFIDRLIPRLTIPTCICLIGPLGIGKTYFSKRLINKLCRRKVNVNSPTYSLVNIYDVPNQKSQKPYQIWHFDLYRIVEEEEVLYLDFLEALENNLVIIEWANKLDNLYPQNALTIEMQFAPENKRLLTIRYVR